MFRSTFSFHIDKRRDHRSLSLCTQIPNSKRLCADNIRLYTRLSDSLRDAVLDDREPRPAEDLVCKANVIAEGWRGACYPQSQRSCPSTHASPFSSPAQISESTTSRVQCPLLGKSHHGSLSLPTGSLFVHSSSNLDSQCAHTSGTSLFLRAEPSRARLLPLFFATRRRLNYRQHHFFMSRK